MQTSKASTRLPQKTRTVVGCGVCRYRGLATAESWFAALVGHFGLTIFFMLAILAPALLSMPTGGWLALGNFLSRFAAPVALAIVFFGVFAMYGSLLRLCRRIVLNLGTNVGASSYWEARTPAEQHASHFHRQF